MEYAILFVLAFLFAWLIHWKTRQWKIAVALPMGLFLCWFIYERLLVSDSQAALPWSFVLIFELPIIFMASLLASYVYETWLDNK